ncbi:MAG: hypothetical protein ACE5ID_11880, partial [Acidobacteriota bacterium]
RLSAFVDSAKKLLMLQGCALCSITHSLTGEKSEWRTCREEIGVPIDYRHQDDVDNGLAEVVQGRVPCIVAAVANHLEMLLTPEMLTRCRGNVADLKGRLKVSATMKDLVLPLS